MLTLWHVTPYSILGKAHPVRILEDSVLEAFSAPFHHSLCLSLAGILVWLFNLNVSIFRAMVRTVSLSAIAIYVDHVSAEFLDQQPALRTPFFNSLVPIHRHTVSHLKSSLFPCTWYQSENNCTN
jgi:hypothetical protein